MHKINWKYCLLVFFDLIIAGYLFMAVTSWNKPSEVSKVCTKVEINIEDENENGFLKTPEVKVLLEKNHMYPLGKPVNDINTRDIEESLKRKAFVKNADCYITDEGYVCISLTQRTPIIRVKASNGDDYYIDDKGGVMPNTQYTSDMIIVTGNVTKQFACKYLFILADVVMDNELWKNQIEQINVLDDKTIEIVPRVGEHIINIGSLPMSSNPETRLEKVTAFVKKQLNRIELFYKYGLSVAGWNKYSYISLEFSNQVICTHKEKEKTTPIPVIAPVVKQETTQEDNNVQSDKKSKEEGEKKNKAESEKKTKEEGVKKNKAESEKKSKIESEKKSKIESEKKSKTERDNKKEQKKKK